MKKRKKKTWVLKSKLVPACRRIWFYSPLRREAVKLSEGKCASCKKYFDKAYVDHIDPIIPITGIEPWDWNTYLNRMFCDISNLQVMCKKCHDAKTKIENMARKMHKGIDKKRKKG